MRKICCQIPIAAFMQPVQYDCPAAKDNSITHAAAAPSNLVAAITVRSAPSELRNKIELRATASEIAAPKPDFDAKAKKRFWSTFWKSSWKENHQRQNGESPVPDSYSAAFMQPLQYDLRCLAAKDNSITQLPRQASWTQPSQCVLRHHVANPNLSTHMTTRHDNDHAAITLRSATRDTHRTTHTWTTTRCRTQTRNRFALESSAAAPAAYARGTFHRRLQPLYTEKHKISCRCFPANTSPMQHSCSHYNAICNQWLNKRRD